MNLEEKKYNDFMARAKKFLAEDPWFPNPDSPEVAWAAGLYEGEGSVFWNPTSLCLSLGSTDLDVVERFKNTWGMGNIGAPEHREGSKTLYRYKLYGKEKVVMVLAAMYDYLGERRQARIVEVLHGR